MSEGDDYPGAVRSPRSSVARRQRSMALHVAFTLVLSLIALGTPVSAASAATTTTVNSESALRAALGNSSIDEIVIDGVIDIDTGEPLTIDRSMAIGGAGPRAEDAGIRIIPKGGNASNQGFVVTGSAHASMSKLSISGADTNNDGGALSVDPGATLDLDSVYIHDNSASEGGGLYNAGTVNIGYSTFSNDTASGKGGAVSNAGTMTVLNSTFTMNIAKQGAAFAVSSDIFMSFVTIVENTSTNKTGAATHENGGTAFIKNSIVANNRGGDGTFHDCSGSPTLNGVLLSSSQGCNPNGEGNLVVPTIAFDPLANNGGPTDTIKLPDSSHPAVGLAVDCKSVTGNVIAEDQRRIERPQPANDGCDSGSYELGDASIAATLTAPSQVSVGAVSVPLADITLAIQQAASAGTSVASTPLSAIPLSAITIGDAPLSAIPLSAIPLSAIPLSAIPLSAISLDNVPLSAIPLSAIPLSAIPLSAIDSVLLSDLSRTDGGSLSDFLTGSIYEGWPLLSLTFGDLAGLPLTSGYLADNSTIASIPLSAIPLSAIGDVTDTDCSTTNCDSTTLGEITPLPGAEFGDVVGLDDINLESTPLSAIPLSAIALGTLPLSAIPLSAIDSSGTELTGLDAWCYYLGDVCTSLDLNAPSTTLISVAIAGVPLSAIPLSAIPLSAIPLSAIPLSAIPLSAINWQSTPLSAIPLSAIVLSGVPLSAICADEQRCSDATDPTLGDVSGLGGFADGASIALLDSVVDNYDYVLWDLLFGLFGSQDIPWALTDNLNAIRLPAAENDPSLAFDYVVGFTLGDSNASITVDLTLPVGFVPVDGFGTFEDSLGNTIGSVSGVETQGLSQDNIPITLHFEVGNLSPGTYTLRVPTWAGVELGSFDASVEVTANAATAQTASDTATVEVVESGVTNRTVTASNMEIAHVASVGDAQVFKLEVPSGIQGASVKLLLSNLTADLDLVLFGPKESDYLRGTPLPGFGTIEDHKYDLNPDDDVLDADVLRDVNTDFSRYGIPTSTQMVPIAVSAKHSTANEEIEARIPTAGPYYAVVSGYNGASSNSAFALQGRFLGNTIACTPLTNTWRDSWPLGTAPSPPTTVPDGLNTLILYNSGRFDPTTPTDAALLSYLQDFEANPGQLGAGVVAMAVPIDAYPNVAEALGIWYSSSGQCDPEAANDVVRAIGTSILDNYPDVANIVIVGDDSQVPFARLVDRTNVSNEASFGATLPTGASPELRSTLAGGYYFSDDPYGSKPGVAFADGEYFVPSIPVGRLVETSDQILAQFQEFTSSGGVLTGKTAAVTGYDFLTDGAQAVSNELQQLDPSPTNVSTLINETWTSGDLVALLENDYSVGSINAHFDQFRLLPAASNSNHTQSDLFTVADLPTVSGSQSNIFDLGALLFSMGCHSGLSVSNVQMTTVPEWARDWAEALTGLGTSWVANSGYGYGDSQVVAYSETISADFAGYLDSTSAGQAWVLAKQQFASGLLSVSPYHTKAMNEFVFFGLPMLETETAASAPAPTLPDAGTGPAIGSDPTGVGLQVAHVEASTGLTPHVGYYSGNGGTLEVRGRALTALGELDVTRPDGAGGLADQALGVVITGLSSTEEDPYSPLFFNPVSGPSGTSDRPHVLDSTFPAGLAHLVTYVGDDGQIRQKIVFAATRFRSDPTDGSIGTLLKYGSFTADVYFGQVGSDTTAPLIERAEGVSDGNIAYFQVEVNGDQHTDLSPTDDTRRVNVLFAPSSGGALDWQTVELVRVPGTNRWVGGAPITDSSWSTTSFSFWVQACDAYANCGASTFKGLDYLTAQAGDGVLVTASGTLGNNGWYVSSVDATATTQAAGATLASYSLDGGAPVDFEPASTQALVSISDDGVHYLVAYDTDGNAGGLLVAIDTLPPDVTAASDPASGWVGSSGATVTLEATDSGSGVNTIEYRYMSSGSFQLYTGPLTGVTQDVEYRATDVAGNTTTGTVSIQFDGTPPTVSASATSAAPNWTNNNVTVVITATDADSGLNGIDYSTSLEGQTPLEQSATTSPVSVPVSEEGKTTVSYTATDNVGNSTSGSLEVWIDKTAPSVALNGINQGDTFNLNALQTASFTCSDAFDGLSPLIQCEATVTGPETATSGNVVATGGASIALPTAELGTYTVTVVAGDAAGNQTTTSLTYDVVDDSPPTALITAPSDSQSFTVGTTNTAAFTCTDPESGISACTAEVSTDNGVSWTSLQVVELGGGNYEATLPGTLGVYLLRVTATNGAVPQLTGTDQVSFSIVYGVCLLYDPTKPQPATGAVAIKLQICDGSGNNLSKSPITVTAKALYDGSGSDLGLDPQDSGQSNSSPTFEFRYDAKLKGYIYNLNQDPPLVPGSYILTFTVAGTGDHDYEAPFALK